MQGTPIFAAGTIAAMAAAQAAAALPVRRAVHNTGSFNFTVEIDGVVVNAVRGMTVDMDETMDMTTEELLGQLVSSPKYDALDLVTLTTLDPTIVNDPRGTLVSIELVSPQMYVADDGTGRFIRSMSVDMRFKVSPNSGEVISPRVSSNGTGGAGGRIWISSNSPSFLDVGDSIVWTLQQDIVVFPVNDPPVGFNALVVNDIWTLRAGSTLTTTILIPTPGTLGLLLASGLVGVRRRRAA